jgi:hypothetical protein
MRREKEPVPDRRDFLKSVVAGAATASLAAPAAALPSNAAVPRVERPFRTMPLLSPDLETDPPADTEVPNLDRSGSDFMLDVLKSLGFEYVCSVAG